MWLHLSRFQEVLAEAETAARDLASDAEGQQAWARSRRKGDKQVFFLIRATTPSVNPLAMDDRIDLRSTDSDLPALFQLSAALQSMLQDVCFPLWER